MIFQKLGGDYQLVIDQPKDMLDISQLRESHWMVTSAPRDSFVCDVGFLKYLDGDNDGRIMSDDVKAALEWLFQRTNSFETIGAENAVLKLSEIDTSHKDGESLIKAAKRILSNLGMRDAEQITLDNVRSRKKILAQGDRNGDGVIPPEAVEEPRLKGFVNDILRTVDGVADAGGKLGVNEEVLDRFLKESQDFLNWIDKKAIPPDQNSTDLMPLGDQTEDAYKTYIEITDKIDDFFNRSWLHKSHKQLQHMTAVLPRNLANDDVDSSLALKSSIPCLSLDFENRDLNFDDTINPAYRELAFKFRDHVLQRIVPKKNVKSMSMDDWELVKEKFKLFERLILEKPATKTESIDVNTLRGYLENDNAEKLRRLIQSDLNVANELKYIEDVEKLLLYRQWLFEFVNNFVSLASLYNPLKPSLVQVGTLIMDGRRFELTTKVIDSVQHKKIVEQSNICVMYLDVTRSDNDKNHSMVIAAAVTAGTMSRLFIGKQGVFYTPDNCQWNAEVTDFVANPVSVFEAIKKPFKQLGEFMTKQGERFSSSRYQSLEIGIGESIKSAEQNLAIKKDDPNKITGQLRDLMLSGSIALAALGSAFAYITKTLQNVSIVKMGSVVGGLVLIIFGPIVAVALCKLRSRNLSVFLEACGWAVNGHMRLTYEMGLLFTHEPKIPKHSRKRRFDSVVVLLNQLQIKAHTKIMWVVTLLLLLILISGLALFGAKILLSYP